MQDVNLPLGRLIITTEVRRAIARSGTPLQEILDRHRRGDWGMVDDFEAEENDYAAEHGGMITSVYWLPIGSVAWISTEGDRSKTYVILPTYPERDGSRSIRDGSRS